MILDSVLATWARPTSPAVGPFWGEPDALHSFCEAKYAYSAVFAEFHNSVSSLVYVLAGLFGAWHCRACGWQVLAGWAALILVGFGSALFHATLRFQFELCDEGPMLLLVAAFLVGKEDCLPAMSGPARRLRFRIVVAALLLGSAAAYVCLQVYEIFLYTFTAGVLAEIAADVKCKSRECETRACFWIAVASIGVGKLVWDVEHQVCGVVPWAWALHSVWHVLSCIGGAFAILHNAFLRKELLGEAF